VAKAIVVKSAEVAFPSAAVKKFGRVGVKESCEQRQPIKVFFFTMYRFIKAR
jgi:hypothetical protein